MPNRRILLIGPTGQIGWELRRCVQPLGQVFPVGKNRSEVAQAYMDLTEPDSIRSVIREVQPAIVLNAAAYTAVDKAEQEPEIAHQINAIAPGIIAEECLRLKTSILVHYSTDYVFDGTAKQPYHENDAVNPIGVYGKSKLAGEQAIAAVGGHYFILRTAWVYGLRGKNFLLTMQRLAQEQAELKVVNDQIGAPTWSRMIAAGTAHLLTQIRSPWYKNDIEELSGIYHLTCSGECSWYDFAKAIIAQCQKQPHLLPISTADYPTPAKRPAYSVLSHAKIMETFGLSLPDWERSLELCLARDS